MQGFVTLAALASCLVLTGPAPALDEARREGDDTRAQRAPELGGSEATPAFPRLHGYLTRELPRSARFLDHGVLALRTAGGTPHRYRLDLQLGLFDHLSVGLTAHWLPGQPAPRVWPVLAVAAWRWRGRSVVAMNGGAHYRPVLFPPVDREQNFVPETHFGLVTSELSAGWFTAGLDLGVAHSRLALADPEDTLGYRRRALFGGGVFARVGNRRVGLTFDALTALSPDPLLVFELALDLRFGAFEERSRGGWASL